MTTTSRWFIAEDQAYYSGSALAELIGDKNKIDNVIICPTVEEIRKGIMEGYDFIHTDYPPKEYRKIFPIVHTDNKFGILTTQEKAINISENVALENRLGLSVVQSSFTMKDVGGAQGLKEFTKKLIKAEERGYKPKGVFLVGVPGTGKTYFPKCFAGETGRLLVMLNLAMIMEYSEPIIKLNEVFKYLDNRAKVAPTEKYILLIDEIEKMLVGSAKATNMLGRLLTVLNDLGTGTSEYAFNAIFFATANNLNAIIDTTPEFLRRGRWDELFFVNLPLVEAAKDMFRLYLKKFKFSDAFIEIHLEDIIAGTEHEYQSCNSQKKRFPYTPSEIETFAKRLDFLRKSKDKDDELTKDDIVENIKMIIPIIKTAGKTIDMMVAQRELFVEI
jgi:SpoVK/Ycf46/Vps4 family AAA+-type ATPase